MTIVSFDITKETRGDALILKKLLKGIPKGMGDFCADPTYLSRDICTTHLKTLQYIRNDAMLINPR